MRITDTVVIRHDAAHVFGFFENIEANYLRWHPGHHAFRWENGGGLRRGAAFHAEETIGGTLLKTRAVVTRVEPNRRIEIATAAPVLRGLTTRVVYDIGFVREGVQLTTEIHPGRFGACSGPAAPEALRQHVREESERIKRIVEEPVEEDLRALRRVVEPYLARLRAAVEGNPAFRLIECGVFFRTRIGVAFGVECERADGTLRDLRLSIRCSGSLPGKDFPGTLRAMVTWHRPPGQGQRERTVYEALGREVRYTGAPPLDAIAAQLPGMESAMQLALARRGPPGRTADVHLVESEADWGRRIDEVVEFASREDAEGYAREYNERYNRGPLRSEWSMIAEVAWKDRPPG
jgi:hypothetical protein